MCPCWRSATACFEVLATAGNNRLGGDDFDQRIIDYLVRVQERERHRPAQRQGAMQRLKEAAEKAKIELSGVTSANINLPFITAGRHRPEASGRDPHPREVQRADRRPGRATEGPVCQALRRGPEPRDLEGAAGWWLHPYPGCAGQGSVLTGKEPFKGINPDECVAMGAAIQGGVSGRRSEGTCCCWT